MKMINGQRIYGEEDLIACLYRLQYVIRSYRCFMISMIENMGLGIDTVALCNIVNDPVEYNIDYLNSLDSEVTELFIRIMEEFGYI